MKWDTDQYKYLKQDIFDLLKDRLEINHANKISVEKAYTEIDNFFEKILNETDCKEK